MLGMHGTRAANLAVQASDLLICVGARFDDRATGKLSTFAPDAKILHLDIDPAEVGKLRRPDVALLGPLGLSLEALARPLSIEPWRRACLESKGAHRWCYEPPTKGVYGPRFLKALSESGGKDLVLACDVGQHQMWVAQHCRPERPEQHLDERRIGTTATVCPPRSAQCRPEATVANAPAMNVHDEFRSCHHSPPDPGQDHADNQSLGSSGVRSFLRTALQRSTSDNPDFTRVGEAFGIPLALELAERRTPDDLRAEDRHLHVHRSPGQRLAARRTQRRERDMPRGAPMSFTMATDSAAASARSNASSGSWAGEATSWSHFDSLRLRRGTPST
jgi:acetolactate synthase-1/2/3 large subunit